MTFPLALAARKKETQRPWTLAGQEDAPKNVMTPPMILAAREARMAHRLPLRQLLRTHQANAQFARMLFPRRHRPNLEAVTCYSPP
jgi:hypothetical protein